MIETTFKDLTVGDTFKFVITMAPRTTWKKITSDRALNTHNACDLLTAVDPATKVIKIG